MIRTFKCKERGRIFQRIFSRKLPRDIQQVAFRKLRMLNRALTLADLRMPPGNRLEMLRDDREGQHSIRINERWRVCFEWREGDAYNVEIVDYHWEIGVMRKDRIRPVHPGEILFEEFLKPMGISQNRLALDLGVPPRRINEIIHGKRRITADTALRLARYFGMSAPFWLGLQVDYDLDVEEDRLADRLQKEVREYSVTG